MAKTKKTKMTKFAVTFGAPGKNKHGKRRLGVTGKMNLSASEYHELLAGASLKVNLKADPNAGKDVEGQQTMAHATPDIEPLETIAEVGRISFGMEDWGCTLILPADVDAETVDAFAFQEGELRCERVGNSAESDDGAGG